MAALTTRYTSHTIPFLRRISFYSKHLLRRYIYTNVETAFKELGQRKAKMGTKEDRGHSDFFPQPMFCMFRHVATPNFEIDLFIKTCLRYKMKGVIWEYFSDKFTSNNVSKHNLAKMPFFFGRGKKGGLKIKSVKIIDFNSYNGKRIEDIRCFWGESLTDFHHWLFRETYPDQNQVSFFDASEWFKSNGGDANHYYENFLEHFVYQAILFENLVTSNAEERRFIYSVFLPAFYTVCKKFKHKPLIVPLLPFKTEGDQYWTCYNTDVLSKTESKLNQANRELDH